MLQAIFVQFENKNQNGKILYEMAEVKRLENKKRERPNSKRQDKKGTQ
jgi:hypothetical protein